MENRESAPYIILANVDGKKTAIQTDGIYTILPPQNFPAKLPSEIQYKDERLPLYNAKEVIDYYGKTSKGQRESYEQLYRDLLVKVKEISDEIINLKKNTFSSIEADLTEKVQDSQNKMSERFNTIKVAVEGFRKQEEEILNNISELETISGENDTNLTNIVTSLSMQDEVESKLISILFSFGIKLKKEENPEDEAIKRGEEMLSLLQGGEKETVNQNDVDQLLADLL